MTVENNKNLSHDSRQRDHSERAGEESQEINLNLSIADIAREADEYDSVGLTQIAHWLD